MQFCRKTGFSKTLGDLTACLSEQPQVAVRMSVPEGRKQSLGKTTVGNSCQLYTGHPEIQGFGEVQLAPSLHPVLIIM